MEETELENDTPENETDGGASENTNGENQEKSTKDLKSAIAQKEHFREKVTKLEKELSEAKSKSQDIRIEKETTSGVDPLEIVTLSKSLSSFSEDETKLIMDAAKDKTPKGILAALNSEVVKDAIAYRREKVERENKRPDSTESFSNGFIDKPMREIEKMSKDEFETYERELIEKSKTRNGRTGA
jgi:hypothetical protein